MYNITKIAIIKRDFILLKKIKKKNKFLEIKPVRNACSKTNKLCDLFEAFQMFFIIIKYMFSKYGDVIIILYRIKEVFTESKD